MTQTHTAHITACTLRLALPGCASLKGKRGMLMPLMAALRRQFGLAVAEIDAQDLWGSAVLACLTVSTETAHNHRVLQSALRWLERNRPDVEIERWTLEEL
ncbi:MAG: DUF503 domain-containing protein [Anaerolineales bacterium]